MDPRRPADVKKLMSAKDASVRVLEPFRQQRTGLVTHMAGNHYGDAAVKEDLPINVIALVSSIYRRNLIGGQPRVMISTPFPDARVIAANFEAAVNQVLRILDLRRELDMLVVNALCGLGIMKVGWTGAGDTEIESQKYEYGRAYAKAVDLDDWVHDTRARTRAEMSFCGNRYRVPLSFAQEYDGFDPDVRSKLVAADKQRAGQNEGDRVEDLTDAQRDWNAQEYEAHVNLWDFWLPRESVIVTVCEEHPDAALQIVPWTGPKEGPYHLLTFAPIPNNLMPVPPLAHLKDLHDLVNSLVRKLGRQAERQRVVGLFQRGKPEDAETISKLADGEWAGVDAPQAAKEIPYGGPDQATMVFAMQMLERVSWQAGNVDSMAGLSAMAETLGAEKLLANNSSQLLRAMQDEVELAAHEIIRAVAWWTWTDRFADIPITRTVANSDVMFSTRFGRDDRVGEFLDYNIDLQLSSLRDMSPSERLSMLDQTMMQVLLPSVPFMEPAGMTPDIEKYLRLRARYTNMPELVELVQFSRPPEPTQPGPMLGENSGMMGRIDRLKPAMTERVERRVGVQRPNNSASGMMMASLMAGKGA